MKNVMIVDDSLELGRLLQASVLVMDPTLKVVVVPSAEEAILESSRGSMDLLVADIRLPGISGLDLVRKIRTRHPTTKVILITGLSDSNLDQQVKDLAVDAFFRKPLEIPEFLEAARKCLGLSSETPAAADTRKSAKEESKTEARPKKKRGTGALHEEEVELPDVLDMLPAQPPKKTLSELLTDLRHHLGALAALVLDERGHILAQAGEPPDGGLVEKLISAWMAVHSPSLKLGALLKPGLPQTIQALRGVDFDALFAPVGAFSLGIVLPVGRSALRLALAFETVLDDLPELADVLGADNVQVSSALQPQLGVAGDLGGEPAFLDEEEALQDEAPLGEFLSVLESAPKGAADADSFWDTSDTPPTVVSTPDMISYDQALQLGLTPEDQKKSEE